MLRVGESESEKRAQQRLRLGGRGDANEARRLDSDRTRRSDGRRLRKRQATVARRAERAATKGEEVVVVVVPRASARLAAKDQSLTAPTSFVVLRIDPWPSSSSSSILQSGHYGQPLAFGIRAHRLNCGLPPPSPGFTTRACQPVAQSLQTRSSTSLLLARIRFLAIKGYDRRCLLGRFVAVLRG